MYWLTFVWAHTRQTSFDAFKTDTQPIDINHFARWQFAAVFDSSASLSSQCVCVRVCVRARVYSCECYVYIGIMYCHHFAWKTSIDAFDMCSSTGIVIDFVWTSNHIALWSCVELKCRWSEFKSWPTQCVCKCFANWTIIKNMPKMVQRDRVSSLSISAWFYPWNLQNIWNWSKLDENRASIISVCVRLSSMKWYDTTSKFANNSNTQTHHIQLTTDLSPLDSFRFQLMCI